MWVEDEVHLNVKIYRPTTKFKILNDALGSTIAWPKICVIVIDWKVTLIIVS